MIKHHLNKQVGTICIVLLMMGVMASPMLTFESWAAPARMTVTSSTTEKITLSVGKSVIIDVAERVKRISMDSKGIADYHLLDPQKIIVTGKSIGLARITLWKDDQTVSGVIDVEVAPNVNELKMKIHELFPEEKNVKVTGANGMLTLSGTASNSANLAQILALAQAYAPKGQGGNNAATVINLVEVGGVHQVMLEVRVAEMSRSTLKRLNINFNVSYIGNQGAFSLGFLPGVMDVPFGNISALYRSGNATWSAIIDALKEDGLTKVLAEPTLITMSGKRANFLAGGEYPIPVPQSGTGAGTTITIEYKTFGVGLNFTPTVLSNNRISMEVNPEVSDLDFSNAVRFQGFVVPGLTTRRVSTVIELADGQSFAIAGLLRDDLREVISKFPVLGDIPILGALFRSTEYQKNETELIVIVTPHLVKPLDMAKQTLPTDQFIEPNDFEFYLMGWLEGKGSAGAGRQGASPRTGGMEGDFGHIIPQ